MESDDGVDGVASLAFESRAGAAGGRAGLEGADGGDEALDWSGDGAGCFSQAITPARRASATSQDAPRLNADRGREARDAIDAERSPSPENACDANGEIDPESAPASWRAFA
ncbi:MAG: hypothetical protein KF724_08725 [Phycisphaeraceae bacterium]|nr:hypothetical protein [Phycisphaeraceae bacterium]